MSKVPAYDQPGPYSKDAHIPATASNAASIQFIVFRAPCNCVVKKFEYTSAIAVAGHATDNKNLNVLYKGADGSTGAAEVANLDLAAGVNLVAFDAKNIPLNGSYPNGVTMAEGDVLAFEIEEGPGTGPATGPGSFYLEFYPTN